MDISQNSDDKDQMREIAGNPTALAPQICNGEVYCGVSFMNCKYISGNEGHTQKTVTDSNNVPQEFMPFNSQIFNSIATQMLLLVKL